MATYAVGDIQGCYKPLRRLLDGLQFDPSKDVLWVVGDLVNRGPNSLDTLRYLKGLGDSCIAILGNHDLHLLAVAEGLRKQKAGDTLDDVLAAADANELLYWLRHRPFIHHDEQRQITMVHAGIPPIWTIAQALQESHALEAALQGEDYVQRLKKLFKKKLDPWSDDLSPKKKLRLTANYLTQMRFCDGQGNLDSHNKSNKPSKGFAPWYSFENSPCYNEQIIFGHWAALGGKSGRSNIHALDTGCVWGKTLTAINVDTFERTSVPA